MITSTVEDYLGAIYILQREGLAVIGARVADHVGVSPATMTGTIKRLTREGYVQVKAGKQIHLTPKGLEVAEGILRRHLLTERLLTDVLGLDWGKAHQEAHRLEHAISPEVEHRLAQLLNHPTTCPHGNPLPLPGKETQVEQMGFPLHQVEAGREVNILRITEEAEKDGRLLAYLQHHGLVPGAILTVVEVAPWLGTVTLRIGGEELALGMEAARMIRVGSQASDPTPGQGAKRPGRRRKV